MSRQCIAAVGRTRKTAAHWCWSSSHGKASGEKPWSVASALQLPRRHRRRPRPSHERRAAEACRDERPVGRGVPEAGRAAGRAGRSGALPRRRSAAARRPMSRAVGRRELVPGAPVDAERGAGTDPGSLLRRAELDDQVGAFERDGGSSRSLRRWRRCVERECWRRPGTARREAPRRATCRVEDLDLRHAAEAPAQAADEDGVDLDRDHTHRQRRDRARRSARRRRHRGRGRGRPARRRRRSTMSAASRVDRRKCCAWLRRDDGAPVRARRPRTVTVVMRRSVGGAGRDRSRGLLSSGVAALRQKAAEGAEVLLAGGPERVDARRADLAGGVRGVDLLSSLRRRDRAGTRRRATRRARRARRRRTRVASGGTRSRASPRPCARRPGSST